MAVGPALPETLLVLDSNILTAWRYQKPGILEALASYQSRHKLIALSSLTVYEIIYGFENSLAKAQGNTEQTKLDFIKADQLINSCIVLPFDQKSAKVAAYMVPRLPKSIPKDTLLDALIAATALAHGYGVATRNRKDFELIGSHTPDDLILRLAVWTP
ncbi:MAG TPA: PIN domain-containing protein [Pyrinomonadaceae bacterium]|jgi:predicted nucleic acid-binding protein|nr:PIN domain-containing protein [Pyrinomonadaceae bacterium]